MKLGGRSWRHGRMPPNALFCEQSHRQDFCQQWQPSVLVYEWWNNGESVFSQVRPGESMKLAAILLCVVLVTELNHAPGRWNISDLIHSVVGLYDLMWSCCLLSVFTYNKHDGFKWQNMNGKANRWNCPKTLSRAFRSDSSMLAVAILIALNPQ